MGWAARAKAASKTNGHPVLEPEAPATEDESLETTIRLLAPSIRDVDHLNEILDTVQGGPEMRAAVRRMIRPYLSFTTPDDER